MATFTPYTNSPNDPSYLGYSKELDAPQPNKTASTILSGISDVADKAIKGIDASLKSSFDEALATGTDTLRNNSIVQGLDKLSQLVGVPTSGITDQQDNIPPAVANGVDKMGKMTSALRQKTIDDIPYYGQMQQLTQNLISRFPGYRDYITDKATHYLGTNAANAQRAAITNALQQLQGGKSTEQDKWTHEVTSNAPYFKSPQEFQEALTAFGNPDKMSGFRVQIARNKMYEHNVKLDDATTERDLKAGKWRSEDMEQKMHREMSDSASFAMENLTFNISGQTGNMNDVRKMVNNMKVSGDTDPDKLKFIGQAVGQIQNKLAASYDEAYRIKRYGQKFTQDGKEYYTDSMASLLKDDNKYNAAKKQYLSMFDDVIQEVGTGNLHLATTNAFTIAGYRENAALKIAANPIAQKYMGMDEAFRQSASKVIDLVDANNIWQQKFDLARFLNNLNMKNVVANGGTQGGLDGNIERWKVAAAGDPKAPPEPPTEYLRASIDHLRTLATHPDMPLEGKVRAAEFIAQQGTKKFIKAFEPNRQFSVWSSIYAPDVTDTVKTSMSGNMWSKYRAIGEEVFPEVLYRQFNELSRSAQNVGSLGLKWNEKTQQIDYRDRSVPGKFVDPVTPVVQEVNRGFATLSYMLAKDGEKITPEYLKKINVDLTSKSKEPSVDELLRTLRNIPSTNPSKQRPAAAAPAPAPQPVQPTTENRHEDMAQTLRREFAMNPQEVLKDAIKVGDSYRVKRGDQWFNLSTISQ